ncbi:unnamed protein product [Clonostachys chloroleuca]|uniref:Uncharacterized protein n=1 Tax=Clonostachys chloroleuca TaxID=1926264 RepID=A0AA35LZF4_9HYPO|nr:unnamed protein product [Clonostachys chloroleuca]
MPPFGVAHIDAWHVREFEVWGERDPAWGEDSEADSDTDPDPNELSEVDSNPNEAPLDKGSEARPWSLPELDIEYFCEKLLKIPDFFPKTNEGSWGDDVRYGLETGRENITKSLMLVHLPRIRAIRCSKAGRGNHPGVEMLLYFAHMDGDFELSDLGVDLLTHGPQGPFDKISPVRTIILDRLENSLSEKLISFLAKIPRALQNIAIRFHTINDHEERSRSAASLVEALSEHQCKSLLRVCFDAENRPNGPFGPFFMPGLDLDIIRFFDDLRVVTLGWLAVEMSLADSDDRLPREELLDRLFRLFQLCLPDKMEILVLGPFVETVGVLLTGELTRGDRDNLGYVDEAVEAAITSRRYDNLKAVILEYVQASLHYVVGGDWLFPKAVKAAEERGIYIGLIGDMPPPGLGIYDAFVPVPTRSFVVTGRLRTEEE